MLEALWSVEFISNLGSLGTGVAVLETDRILGGDSTFMYVGDYHVVNGMVESEIKVTKYSNVINLPSIFGQLHEFNVKVSGKVDRESMIFTGHLLENPSLQVTIKMVRRVELPNP
jgi:hypothetical protein